MKIDYCGVCDKGLKREINQDAILKVSGEEVSLFAVADGMGGHSFGERASAMIISGLQQWWKEFSVDDFDMNFGRMVLSLRQRIELVNRNIYETYSKNNVCGSTLVVLFIWHKHYAVLSCGDSRIYQLHGWKFKQLTRDDVWENQPDVRKKVNKKLLKECVNYGKLVSAVGIDENILLNVNTNILSEGDRFLLCSDGLYKMCGQSVIKKVLKKYKGRENGEEILRQMLRMVYENGARDNVSVIMAMVKD